MCMCETTCAWPMPRSCLCACARACARPPVHGPCHDHVHARATAATLCTHDWPRDAPIRHAHARTSHAHAHACAMLTHRCPRARSSRRAKCARSVPHAARRVPHAHAHISESMHMHTSHARAHISREHDTGRKMEAVATLDVTAVVAETMAISRSCTTTGGRAPAHAGGKR